MSREVYATKTFILRCMALSHSCVLRGGLRRALQALVRHGYVDQDSEWNHFLYSVGVLGLHSSIDAETGDGHARYADPNARLASNLLFWANAMDDGAPFDVFTTCRDFGLLTGVRRSVLLSGAELVRAAVGAIDSGELSAPPPFLLRRTHHDAHTDTGLGSEISALFGDAKGSTASRVELCDFKKIRAGNSVFWLESSFMPDGMPVFVAHAFLCEGGVP